MAIMFSFKAAMQFQSTLPCGSDSLRLYCIQQVLLFQSTLPCGSDLVHGCFQDSRQYFNPRSLAGATYQHPQLYILSFISIHAPLRERPRECWRLQGFPDISIHAPLRERRVARQQARRPAKISIHAPLRERHYASGNSKKQGRFQSTLPCGSDRHRIYSFPAHQNFNPRSLAGATKRGPSYLHFLCISIHAPLRERPKTIVVSNITIDISIHAPLRERLLDPLETQLQQKISIHAPLRERRNIIKYTMRAGKFQSTLPCGSDRKRMQLRLNAIPFQSTLPCGSDFIFKGRYKNGQYFNPRSLAGATRRYCPFF